MSLFEFIKIPSMMQSILLATYPKREFTLRYRIRNLFSIAMLFSLCLCLTYHAVRQVGDFVKFSESLYVQITVLNSFSRVVIMVYKRKEFLKCIDMLKTPSFITYNEQYGFEFKQFKKLCVGTQMTYFILGNICLVGYALYPVFGSKTLPFEFNHFNSGRFYYPFYVYQVIAMYISGCSLTAVDLLSWGFLMISVFQLKKLNRKLVDMRENVRKLPNYSEGRFEKLVSEYLKECCVHYSDIDEFSKCIQDCFRIIYFVQMVACCVSISNTLMILTALSPASADALTLICYTICVFIELGVYCWFGNMVYDESLKIITSCYFFPWYECGPSIRRTLFILMERAKRPIEAKGLNLITLSLETFISILKWTYSYYTLLKDYT